VEIDCGYQIDQGGTGATKGITGDTSDMSLGNRDSTDKTSDTISDAATKGFSVAFDPLDGSSIVDANFAVGTIVGVWPGDGLLGRKGREQVPPHF
jgi:hypothetical protein